MTTRLPALAEELLEQARAHESGRAASSPRSGRDRALHHTLLALVEGQSLAEHENPGEATLQVLHGRVTLNWGDNAAGGTVGELLEIPDARHSLDAEEDSVVMLTTVGRAWLGRKDAPDRNDTPTP